MLPISRKEPMPIRLTQSEQNQLRNTCGEKQVFGQPHYIFCPNVSQALSAIGQFLVNNWKEQCFHMFHSK